MRLTQLQYLLEIKKHGSISKAAQHLYIAQPSMSAAIKELEQELGYELMKRSKKGVMFTVLGEQVIEKASHILQEIEEIRTLDSLQTGDIRGRVFLSAIPSVCDSFLLELMIQLKEHYPELYILLEENDAASIREQLRRRETDLGVIMICSNEEERYWKEIEKNQLVFTELYQDEMCFLVGQKNPLYHQAEATLSEILQCPYVYYKNSLTEDDIQLFGQYCDVELLETVQMKDKESVKKYVMYSNAAAAYPMSAIRNHYYLESGQLKLLRITDAVWSCRIGILHRKDTPLKREELFLIQSLQNWLQHTAES